MPDSEVGHRFTRSDIRQAEHEFAEMIRKYFGEVWRIKEDGEYRGVSWDCRSMVALDSGLWRLCQTAIHKGAKRAAGRIESKDSGYLLRFLLFYEPEKKKEETIIKVYQ